MSSHLHLQLAEIASLYDRLVSIHPPEKWSKTKLLKPALRNEVNHCSFEISRRIDAIRELIDGQILMEDIDLHNSKKAKTFFELILPRTELILNALD